MRFCRNNKIPGVPLHHVFSSEDLATHELAASVKTEPTAEPSTRQQTVFTTAEEEMENQQKQDDISKIFKLRSCCSLTKLYM